MPYQNYNNYNNGYYFNPYNANPYSNYQNNMYQQPNQQIQQMQQLQPMPQAQQAPVQKNYLPMIFVNGVEGAKAYLLDANQTVFLKDSDSDLLFEKTTDMNGKPTLKSYKVVPADLDSSGKEIQQTKKPEYATKSDIEALQDEFNKSIDKLSNDIKIMLSKGE